MKATVVALTMMGLVVRAQTIVTRANLGAMSDG